MDRAEYRQMAALEGTHWWYRALHDHLVMRLREMALPGTARVLDAGCGTGGLLARLRTEFPGWRLLGVERDAEAAGIATSKSRSCVVRGDVGALPCRDGSFDAIVCADVLYHRDVCERAALAEFRRCLAPAGHLLVHVPAYEWMRSSHDEHVHGARRYTAGAVRRLLTESGFRIVEVGYRNSLLYPLMAVHRLTSGRRTRKSHLQSPSSPVNGIFATVCGLELRLARFGVRFPAGGSVWAWAAAR